MGSQWQACGSLVSLGDESGPELGSKIGMLTQVILNPSEEKALAKRPVATKIIHDFLN